VTRAVDLDWQIGGKYCKHRGESESV